MNLIIWLAIGGLIGWAASALLRTYGQQGIVLNVGVGIVGALLGGWFVAPLVAVSPLNQNHFSSAGLLVSLMGAVTLLVIVNVFLRGSMR